MKYKKGDNSRNFFGRKCIQFGSEAFTVKVS